MYNKELLDTVKGQQKGIIDTKRDYKIFLQEEKDRLEKENQKYDYSLVYSIVFDGVNSIKITYTNVPVPYEVYDYLKQFTNFRYLTITLDEIKDLKFVD